MLISHDVVKILKKVDIFSTLTYSQLISLSNVTENIEIPAGNIIITENERSDDLFVIVNGKVSITSGGNKKCELGPYSLLGELAFLDGMPRTATATALDDVVLLRIKSEVLYELLDDDIDLVRAIIKYLCATIRGYYQNPTSSTKLSWQQTDWSCYPNTVSTFPE